MKTDVCPICYSELEVRDVAPCWDCGHLNRELDDLKNEEHTYSVFRVFGSHEIVLCDFCDVDFGSYLPPYFGLPETGKVIDCDLDFIRELPKPWIVTKDKFCPTCEKKLKFITFRKAVLDQNGET